MAGLTELPASVLTYPLGLACHHHILHGLNLLAPMLSHDHSQVDGTPFTTMWLAQTYTAKKQHNQDFQVPMLISGVCALSHFLCLRYLFSLPSFLKKSLVIKDNERVGEECKSLLHTNDLGWFLLGLSGYHSTISLASSKSSLL